ncbi:MAG: EscU/YscU/HrcU family type III secretion system export apparatus switch protein, partial [Myxococcota bacterium]|nr:EscU/YscU/HrcU family type III secretion system export apparatus switch protein [Myxococcota bacterium]
MAENDDGQEKTQEPTGKRLGDAREKGQLAKTRELYGLVSIVVGLGGLLFYIFPLSKRVLHFAVSIYAQIPYTEFNDAVLGQLIQYIVYTLANVLALPMLFLWAILMVVGFAQNRFVLPKESLKFDPTRLNPIKGFKEKILSWQPVVELI